MRLRSTITCVALALLVLSTPLLSENNASAQDGYSSASRSSTSRGGRIIRSSNRSRIDTADRLAAYQDAAIDAPSVPEMADEGPMPPSIPNSGSTYMPEDSMYMERGGSYDGGCDSGSCDGGGCSGCSSCGSSFMGMHGGLLGSFGGGCSSCDSGCDSCGGGCDSGCGCGMGCGEGFLCSLLSPCGCTDMLMPPMMQGSGFFIDGWIDHGFTGNPDDPNNKFNSPQAFNDRANEYQMNQAYLTFGREVGGGDCGQCGYWDVGGRVDAFYGTDYFYVESLGLELNQDGTPRWNSEDGPRRRVRGGNITEASLYGLAMPQAYAEVYAPVLDGMRIKVGHFYTIIGYESVMAPENFFYSHSYTQTYGEPFTHTGMLASVDWTDCWTASFGFTRGWDNWENPFDEYSFLGGVTWTGPTKRTSVSAAVHWGDEAGNNRSVYSLVFRHRINRCFTWVVQHDGGHEDNTGVSGTDTDWFSIANYTYWSITPKLDIGFRYEFFHDTDNSRVFGFPSVLNENNDYHNWTLGANYRACENLIIRPELRADYSTVLPLGQGGMYNDFSEQSQFTMSVDMIHRF